MTYKQRTRRHRFLSMQHQRVAERVAGVGGGAGLPASGVGPLRVTERSGAMTPGQSEGDARTPGSPERGGSRGKGTREPSAPGRVLSIHAHPDDQEFTVAGTLAKWARAGSTVVTVCITSGNAGSNEYTPPSMTREALAPIREEEQRDACRVLGISEVIFLGYEDGMLEPSIALRRDLTRVIRRHRPDAVVCGDPTVRFYGGSYLNHPDHRVAADVTLDAVFPSAETRLIFPELLDEGLEPHKVQAVFIHGSEPTSST